MATYPPQQRAPMGDDAESAAEDGMQGEEADTGTELCIKIGADGQISVYKEAGEDETAEQSAQPVSDIGQALAWCLKEYKAMATQGKDATSQLQAGFGDAQQPAQRPGAFGQ